MTKLPKTMIRICSASLTILSAVIASFSKGFEQDSDTLMICPA
ncbi:hypothetical protein SAMN04488109_2411 [Chryseolinea serpens]|uniref:Uncharacterized protein n=1 Tax=Chryseolinea serpens TaxID=947013 RepID=A0A1M5NLQ6_9BACT|nr:hypothetical protein SAMN04488109_2411 [Chryseolinea serpens]